MMTDHIDRQAAIEVLNKLARSNFTLKPGYEYYLGALHDAGQDIKYLPSADVVPVVRCKDCAVLQTCRFAQGLGLDGYCSQGEKMDGEEHEL